MDAAARTSPIIFPLFFARKVIIVDAMEKSNLEIRVERIEKVVNDIQHGLKAINTRMAGMDALMAGMDARMARMETLMEGIGRRAAAVERKAEKTENRLWLIAIAVIVAGAIPTLIAEILS